MYMLWEMRTLWPVTKKATIRKELIIKVQTTDVTSDKDKDV